MNNKDLKKKYEKALKLKEMLKELTQKISKFKILFNEVISTKKEGNLEDLLKKI